MSSNLLNSILEREPAIFKLATDKTSSKNEKKEYPRASPKQKDLVRGITKKLEKLAQQKPIEWSVFFSKVIEYFFFH